MTGLVLCGGKSNRMGTDKGLMEAGQNTWARQAYNLLYKPCSMVYTSINNTQIETYSAYFTKEQLIIDNESLNIRGPMLGLLSAHLALPDKDLLILACDLPQMDPVLLETLIQRSPTPKDAVIFTNNAEPEPLFGIYKASGLATIYQQYKNETLRKYSMKFVLEQLSCDYIPLEEEYKSAFKNFNAHADFNGM